MNSSPTTAVVPLETDEELTIVVDTREEASGIPKRLEEDDLFVVRREQLAVADYLVGGVAVERKAVADLERSVQEGRFFRQMLELRRCFRRRLLLIEGLHAGEWVLNTRWRGLIVKVSAGLQIPVVLSRSITETVSVLRKVALQEYRMGGSVVTYRPKASQHDTEFLQRYVLLGIPGIGLVRAQGLLRHFGSLSAVFAASTAELAQVAGVSGSQARRMRELLTAKFGSICEPE